MTFKTNIHITNPVSKLKIIPNTAIGLPWHYTFTCILFFIYNAFLTFKTKFLFQNTLHPFIILSYEHFYFYSIIKYEKSAFKAKPKSTRNNNIMIKVVSFEDKFYMEI